MKSTTLTKITLISICVAIGLGQIPIAQAQSTPTAPQTPTSPSSTPNKPGELPTTTTPPTPTSTPSSTTTPQTPTSPSSTPNKPGELPTVTAPQPPQVIPSDTPSTPASAPTTPDTTPTATALTLKVSCDNLTTIVQKGDRKAPLFNWRTNYFGTEYTPDKRCQLVSARLQTAADGNGGTLKGLELGSGTLNSQPVVCILGTGENSCTDRNLLFTLNPENAKSSQAVIAKILTFANDGSTTVDESARISSKSNGNLGSWERQAFPASKKTPTRRQNPNTGF
jgi:Circadian oscillating protein COP23